MRGHSPLTVGGRSPTEWGEIEISTSSLEEHGAGGGLSLQNWMEETTKCNQLQSANTVYLSIINPLAW